MIQLKPYTIEPGERFGKLLVLRRAKKKPGGRPALWVVGCDCGSRFKARGADLRKGRVTACLKCK